MSTNISPPNFSTLNKTSESSTENWKLEHKDELIQFLDNDDNESPSDSGVEESNVQKPSLDTILKTMKKSLGL